MTHFQTALSKQCVCVFVCCWAMINLERPVASKQICLALKPLVIALLMVINLSQSQCKRKYECLRRANLKAQQRLTTSFRQHSWNHLSNYSSKIELLLLDFMELPNPLELFDVRQVFQIHIEWESLQISQRLSFLTNQFSWSRRIKAMT